MLSTVEYTNKHSDMSQKHTPHTHAHTHTDEHAHALQMKKVNIQKYTKFYFRKGN